MTESKKPLTILLASPRGFCAGVDRAVQIVECKVPDDHPVVFSAHGVPQRRLVA